jgi:hypothetical protein
MPGAGGKTGGNGGDDRGAGAPSDAGSGAEPTVPRACGATRDCKGTFLHRSDGEVCSLPHRDTEPSVCEPDCGLLDDNCSEQRSCSTDLDCTDNTYCTFERQDGLDGYRTEFYIHCTLACQTDADCATGEVCLCRPTTKNTTRAVVSMGVCTRAECTADNDCAGGYQCISPVRRRHIDAFQCQSARDECWGPEDCPGPPPDDRCDAFPVCYFDGYFRCRLDSDSDEEDCSDL